MNFEEEQYVRVYTRRTITARRLGFAGRAVLRELMCEADRAGIIEVGNGDLVEAVFELLQDVPEETVRVGLERLTSHGVTERHGSKLLIVRFQEGQEAKRSDAARAKEYRQRRRSELVTPRDESQQNDTPRDGASHTVTARHESSLSALPCSALPSSAGTREDAPPEQLKVFRTDAAGTRAIDPLRASFAAPEPIAVHAFAAWAKAFGKSGVTYDSRRAACLAERVGAGMTAQDSDDAIAGALADDYVNGQKDGKKHDRLIFIFGDAERFEEFRDAGRVQRERPSGVVRKASIAEQIAADQAAEEQRRAELGIRPIGSRDTAVRDPAELDRLLAGVGGMA